NYTLQPRPDSTTAVQAPQSTSLPCPQPCTGYLRSPELTGMPEPALDELINQLSQPLEELRERARSQQRGGERLRARGAGGQDKLTNPARVLATVLYLRKIGTRDLLAQLFKVSGSTLTRAIHQVQPLLAEHSRTISPSTARFRTPTDVTAFLANGVPTKIKPTR
ncbi:helix-turn-helix domain-containing protein, partial [Streptomyces sp. me109]